MPPGHSEREDEGEVGKINKLLAPVAGFPESGCQLWAKEIIESRSVEQLASPPASGAGDPQFKSGQTDQSFCCQPEGDSDAGGLAR